MANEISWFHSGETGAPVLNNAAGSLDAVLHACLVTGFNTQTVTSITVASGVATVTKAGHGFADKMMVDHSGATPSGLNGRAQITVTGSGSYTFPAPGVADGTATGTITAKRSPLGWVRAMNSGNVSIYERTDVTATSMALRIDDSAAGVASATYARVLQVWGHTSTTSFANRAPLQTQVADGLYWPRGTNNTTPKPWVIVGDSRTFYIFIEGDGRPAPSYDPQGIFGFGDVASEVAGDPYSCGLWGLQSASSGNGGLAYAAGLNSSPSFAGYMARPFFGLGDPVTCGAFGMGIGVLGGQGQVFPSPVNNGVRFISPVLQGETVPGYSTLIRGEFRGLHVPMCNMNRQLHLKVLDSLAGTSRSLLVVAFAANTQTCSMAFDITGPWV
jgi:hypothetical protein